MRIKKLTVKNFRCFKHAEFDLDADIVAIYGRNGVGKTSFFDAIEYSLLGNIARFELGDEATAYLKNIYSADDISIRIDFQNKVESWLQVDNTGAGVNLSGSTNWGSQKNFLYDALVLPKYQTGKKDTHGLAEILRNTVLLSQESIRAFVNGKPDLRARVLTYLAGDAYAQKCLIKAGRVEKEALTREKEERSKLSMQQLIDKDVKDKIIQLESKLNTFKTKIQNTQPKNFQNLVSSLRIALITQSINEPQTTDELESIILLVKSACEERFIEISEKNQTLAEIEILSIQQDSRNKRLLQIQKDLDTEKESLEKHRESQSETGNAVANAAKELQKAEDEKRLLIRRVEIHQRIPSLRLEIDRLKNLVSQQRQVVDQLQEKQKSFSGILKERQDELALIRKDLHNLQDATGTESKKLDILKLKNTAYSQYANAKVSIADINLRIPLIEQNRVSAVNTLNLGLKKITDLNNKLNVLNNEIGSIDTTLNESKTLIARLKEFSKSPACPLCGHDHKTNEQLISAIDQQLKSVPSSLQELLHKSQELTNEKAVLLTQEAALTVSIQALEAEREKLSTAKNSQQKIVSDFEADLELMGILFTQEAIEEAILNSTNLIADRQSQLQKNQMRLDSSKTYEANIQVQLKDTIEALEKQTPSLEKYSLELNEKELHVQELFGEAAISEDTITSGLDTLKKELVTLEQKRTEAIKTSDDLKKKVVFSSSEILRLEIAIAKLEEEQMQLVRLTEDFNIKCKKIELASTSVDAIDAARAQITTLQLQINEALKVAEEYRWARYTELINNDYSILKQQREEAAIEIEKSKLQIIKLEEVLEIVKKWKSVLDDFVNSSVERTIKSYLPDIVRFFKAMIPFPYLFEGINMFRDQLGISLDLKYRGRDASCGEPRYYLSNAQANVLALSIFLTLSSQQSWSRLRTIMLDDPVQHLDDLDAVSFLDGLRNIALGHFGTKNQIIISTCDLNLYLLILKKYSSIKKSNFSFIGMTINNNGDNPDIQYDFRS